jgi:hypothetical protein
LTSRYGRRSSGLSETLRAVALTLGGRAGARLACPASRSTLLRLIRALPDPAAGTPKVLGVDDVALRSCLRHRPGGHREPAAGGHAPRAVRGVLPRLARCPPWRPGDLPGPRRLLCRGRCPRRTARHPGRRPLAVRHEAPGCIPGSAGRNSEGGSWVCWLTWIRKVKGTTACQAGDGHREDVEGGPS